MKSESEYSSKRILVDRVSGGSKLLPHVGITLCLNDFEYINRFVGHNFSRLVLIKTTDIYPTKTTILFSIILGGNLSRNQGVNLKWSEGVSFIWREWVNLRGFSTNSINLRVGGNLFEPFTNMNIQDTLDILKINISKFDIEMYPGVSDWHIANFERRLNLKLPDDLKYFYKVCNGFESAGDMFRINPLDDIPTIVDKFNADHFYVAEYMTYCDMWYLKINPQNNNDYSIFNFDRCNNKLILTNSFSNFINRFLIGGVFEKDGLYDWHEEIRKSSF